MQQITQIIRSVRFFGFALLVAGNVQAMDATDAPESVEIDTMAALYTAVEFDHSAHVDMVECVECHHHTTGEAPVEVSCARCHKGAEEADTVLCSDCHSVQPFLHENLVKLENPDIFHVDKPGLKGAYHLKCVGCHQNSGGPTGCQDCHQMTEQGEKRFNTGKYAPEGYQLPSSVEQPASQDDDSRTEEVRHDQ